MRVMKLPNGLSWCNNCWRSHNHRVPATDVVPGFYWLWEKTYSELRVIEITLEEANSPGARNFLTWSDRFSLYGPIPIPAELRVRRRRQLAERRKL